MIRKHQSIFLFVIITILFVFLRLFNIQNSLLFFNDLGRDLLVLLDWQNSGKPPLLGPQTSSLPFNQSAIYFYLLYPLFVVTKHSLYSPIFTLLVFYLSAFALTLFLVKENKKLTKITFLTYFLFSIHPQFIVQNRYVWNPSFVAPLIFLSLVSFFLLLKKHSLFRLFAFTFSLSLATSFSYSTLPVLMVLFFFLVLKNKRFFLTSSLFLIFFFLTNLPTVFFELRHRFPLTKALMNNTSSPNLNGSLFEKTSKLVSFSLSTPYIFPILLLLALIVIFIIKPMFSKDIKKLCTIYFLAFLFTILLPFPIHSHYIFPTLTIFLVLLSFFFYKKPILLVSITVVFWLSPSILKNHFKPASRTPNQTIQCAKSFCQKEKDPIFVTVQANNHPYHYGPEFRFLLKDQGCQVHNIEKEPDKAQKMAVVIDNSSYKHQETSFYELDLFGLSNQESVFTCQNNLKIHILSKTN